MVSVKLFIVTEYLVKIFRKERKTNILCFDFYQQGFIKFLEGYYMVVITRRSQVARIGYHRIYKIDETSMLSITNEDVKKPHPDESK